MAKRPRLLDLYCGAGGAAMGYYEAGFDVTGVDIKPQPRFPFDFKQDDALEFLAEHGGEFDVIHASPPCQAYTSLRALQGGREYPDLVAVTRKGLLTLGVPFVIENVPGSPLRDPIVLCGSMFGLGARCRDGEYRYLRRHRLFESNTPLAAQRLCDHAGKVVGVYGYGGGGHMTGGSYKGHPEESKEAMGIDWMRRREISQAIPPAYTKHLGEQIRVHVDGISSDEGD